jgi:hypothetical protein
VALEISGLDKENVCCGARGAGESHGEIWVGRGLRSPTFALASAFFRIRHCRWLFVRIGIATIASSGGHISARDPSVGWSLGTKDKWKAQLPSGPRPFMRPPWLGWLGWRGWPGWLMVFIIVRSTRVSSLCNLVFALVTFDGF